MTSAITAAGVGSGLDVTTLVSQLMAVERQPIDTLNTKITSYNSQLSAYGQVKGALSALQTAADAISTPAKFSAFTTTVSDTSVFSATTGVGATAGSYAVKVQQLAQNNKLVSAGYASTSTPLATGSLKIELGSVSGGTFTAGTDSSSTLNITVDSSNNTLTGIRNAINSANAGVTATIVDDGSSTPAHLVISSKNSGTANTIKISGDLADLNFDPANPPAGTTGMQQAMAAQDAIVNVDGITLTKSSNTITDGISGVTLNLTKAAPGTTVNLNVATDTTTEQSNIQAFVTAYNTLNTKLRSLTSYDATTKTAGALNGDSTVRQIATQMRNLVGGALSGSPGGYSRLSDLGISFQKDGSLSVDSTKLGTALTNPNTSVAAFFAGSGTTQGLAAKASDAIDAMLGSGGLLTNRTDAINGTIKRANDQIDTLETRMTQIEARYKAQFTALDTLMSSMSTTSSYLTQQLARM
ncbi:MAG: flagellar filament capping protein FliD [Zoogloea sp.]|nr:flagellar filament capping protein FliD [Zoogloea sp.]